MFSLTDLYNLEHELHVWNTYGSNWYNVYFYTKQDIEYDPYVTDGDFEGCECGPAGHGDDLIWRQHFKKDHHAGNMLSHSKNHFIVET